METHSFFCKDVGCKGVTKWNEIKDLKFVPVSTNCIVANEFNAGIQGIKFGVRAIDKPESVAPFVVDNFLRTSDEIEVVRKDLEKEANNGWIARVLEVPRWLTSMFCNYEETKIRIIKNFSSPSGRSCNDAIDDCPTCMMNVRSAIPMIKPFCYMAKSDVDSAFRRIPVHPEHCKFMNYQLEGQYYNERFLTWGLKSSMFYFNRYTMLVRFMMIKDGYRNVLVYVDDFMYIDENEEECLNGWMHLNALLDRLGLPVCQKPAKLVKPTQRIKFLGLWICSNTDGQGTCQISMDPEKLEKLRRLIREIINKDKSASVTTHDLDCLAGLMVHVGQTAFAARGFCKSTFAMKSDKKFKGKLSKAFMCDMKFWIKEFEKYDGKSMVLHQPQLSKEYWATDAAIDEYPAAIKVDAKFVGIGSFRDGLVMSVTGESKGEFLLNLTRKCNRQQWQMAHVFPFRKKSPATHTIQFLELFAVWFDMSSDPSKFKDLHLPLRIDNKCALSWLIKGTAPVPYMPLVRAIQKMMFENNITLYPVYVRSAGNKLADMASRGQVLELNKLLPNWQKEVEMTVKLEVAKHLYPGPLFMYGKGYFDGREVPDAWGETAMVVESERMMD